MKKVLVTILALVAVCVVVVLGLAATKPGHYRVERKSTVTAPPESVFAHVDDLRRWPEWSPWEKLDPAMKRTFDGPERGVGATYAWAGNDQVGEGKMTVIESVPDSRVVTRLEFIKPWSVTSLAEFAFAPAPGGTEVTWAMEGDRGFTEKIFCVFMDMDAMIGKDFEAGLAGLESATRNAPPALADTSAATL